MTGLALVAAGCIGHASPGPRPPAGTPRSYAPVGPLPGPRTEPWRLTLREDVAGLAGERMFMRNHQGDGIAEHSARDGSHLRTRKIAGSTAKSTAGRLTMWQAAPGGWFAGWHAPTFIREVDGSLEVGWTGTGNDWIGAYKVVAGESALAVESRKRAAIVNLALADGRMRWWAPLPAGLELDALEYDEDLVYVALHIHNDWGTAAETIPTRVLAFDRATGDTRWTVDFADEADAVTADRGTVVAAVRDELRFIDGASGRTRRRVAVTTPLRYAMLRVVGDRVIAALITARPAVSSIDLATSAVQWTTELPLAQAMAILGDTVFVTTQSRSVAALDLSSGAIRWTMGVGVRAYQLLVSEAAVVADGSGEVGGFALPVTGADEQATIRGRVLEVECGSMDMAELHVGDTPVTVAADGSFSATIRARGLVFVAGVGSTRRGADLSQHPYALVRLDGRGTYTVPDLTLGRCEYE